MAWNARQGGSALMSSNLDDGAPLPLLALVVVVVFALVMWGAAWLGSYEREKRAECEAKICAIGKRPLRTRDGYCLCFDVPTATSARQP